MVECARCPKGCNIGKIGWCGDVIGSKSYDGVDKVVVIGVPCRDKSLFDNNGVVSQATADSWWVNVKSAETWLWLVLREGESREEEEREEKTRREHGLNLRGLGQVGEGKCSGKLVVDGVERG